MPGFFITFEGIDGCGKSTQIAILAEHLATCGISYLLTREPGGTPIGNQIREILLKRENQQLVATAELLLYAADRAQHVAEELRPHLSAGEVVLCDRYTDATLAYQGYGRQLSQTLIEELNRIATAGLTPDLTLLFDLSVEAAQARVAAGINKRGAADRLDIETHEFHTRVRAGYLELLARYPERYVMINASEAPEKIFTEVCTAIAPRLPADLASGFRPNC